MAVRRGRLAVVGVVAVVAIGVIAAAAFGIRALFRAPSSTFVAETCTVSGYDIDPSQASVAATMVGAVRKYKVALPVRAEVLVLAAGLQESKLTNLAPGEGDRDSVGVLQQRPSQGWGKGNAKVLTDVGEATTEFLDALRKVPDWQTLPLADAVQKVQISADGSLYAQHEPQAAALAAALDGSKPAGITCTFPAPTQVAAATTVATQAGRELGIDTARASGTHRVQVPGAHWQTVAWFVANADRLGIDQVDYAGKRWTREHGWKDGPGPGTAVVATLATTGRK